VSHRVAPAPGQSNGTRGDSAAANPLVTLIRSQPGMAERLLVEHADDGSGRCRCCTAGAQSGRYQFPCAIALAATDAGTSNQAGGGTVIGGGR
jgi:hypothetical protein